MWGTGGAAAGLDGMADGRQGKDNGERARRLVRRKRLEVNKEWDPRSGGQLPGERGQGRLRKGGGVYLGRWRRGGGMGEWVGVGGWSPVGLHLVTRCCTGGGCGGPDDRPAASPESDAMRGADRLFAAGGGGDETVRTESPGKAMVGPMVRCRGLRRVTRLNSSDRRLFSPPEVPGVAPSEPRSRRPLQYARGVREGAER